MGGKTKRRVHSVFTGTSLVRMKEHTAPGCEQGTRAGGALGGGAVDELLVGLRSNKT